MEFTANVTRWMYRVSFLFSRTNLNVLAKITPPNIQKVELDIPCVVAPSVLRNGILDFPSTSDYLVPRCMQVVVWMSRKPTVCALESIMAACTSDY